MNRRPAIVLLSGGLDSATCLAMARAEGFSPIRTLAFDYAQRHRHELTAARTLATHFGAVEHRVIAIDLRQFGGSALTDDAIGVPKDQIGAGSEGGAGSASVDSDIPVTYVPARNTVFLSFALAWAEVLGCDDVFIGVNALDYSGYPDCRPEFIDAFRQAARLGTKRTGFTIHAPLINLTKAQIIAAGVALGVDYAMTHSCYDPVTRDGQILACGHCDSCILRRRGFEQAGVVDPTRYT